jgi:D-arabinonate dehydratase
MKITNIEVIPLVKKLEQAFVGGTYRIVNRNTIVTRIHTDAGIVGEAFGGDEDHTQRQIVDLIRDHFSPMLRGEDARDVERIWERMFHSNIDLGNRALHVLDLGNRSILMQAIAAVDNALWDALAKLYNVPLYKLLGGYRDKVPVIAIGGYYEATVGGDPLAQEIQQYKEWQLAGMKFKVGRVSVAEDVRRVEHAV